jgi:hypothetical protein
LHENPGLVLHGLEDIRILNGIRLSEQTKLIRLLAGKAQSREGVFEVDLELRNGVREGKDIIHSRARAILAENLAPPPEFRLPEALSASDYPRSVAEIYEKILFHGSRLHGLRTVRTARGRHGGGCVGCAGVESVEPAGNSWLVGRWSRFGFQMASSGAEQRDASRRPSTSPLPAVRPAFPPRRHGRSDADATIKNGGDFCSGRKRRWWRVWRLRAVMDPLQPGLQAEWRAVPRGMANRETEQTVESDGPCSRRASPNFQRRAAHRAGRAHGVRPSLCPYPTPAAWAS